MFTIKENVNNEITINKSRFITFAYKVKSLKEVPNIIISLKKEYKDATHYCFAYKMGSIKRFNDDGEPSHTAGIPILNVIESKNLDNILIVVIRYFGGIKLGAGGLIRAYSNSASEVINKTEIIQIKKENKARIEFDYNNIRIVNYILKDYKIIYKEFNINVIYEFIYQDDNYPEEINNYIEKRLM